MKYLFVSVCVCLNVNISTVCVKYLRRSEDGVGYPVTVAIGIDVLPRTAAGN